MGLLFLEAVLRQLQRGTLSGAEEGSLPRNYRKVGRAVPLTLGPRGVGYLERKFAQYLGPAPPSPREPAWLRGKSSAREEREEVVVAQLGEHAREVTNLRIECACEDAAPARPVNPCFFGSLQSLSLVGTPLEFLEGLFALRQQLQSLSYERALLQSLAALLDPPPETATAEATEDASLAGDLLGTGQLPALRWSRLEALRVSFCGLEALDASLRRLPQLRRAEFTHNKLESVDFLQDCVCLEHLDLSYNNIASCLGWNTRVGNLVSLSLRGNRLRHTDGLERLYSLERLDLSYNDVSALREVTRVGTLPCLASLALRGNPFEARLGRRYRITVLSLVRQGAARVPGEGGWTGRDLALDGRYPSKTERLSLQGLQFCAPEMRLSSDGPRAPARNGPRSPVEEDEEEEYAGDDDANSTETADLARYLTAAAVAARAGTAIAAAARDDETAGAPSERSGRSSRSRADTGASSLDLSAGRRGRARRRARKTAAIAEPESAAAAAGSGDVGGSGSGDRGLADGSNGQQGAALAALAGAGDQENAKEEEEEENTEAEELVLALRGASHRRSHNGVCGVEEMPKSSAAPALADAAAASAASAAAAAASSAPAAPAASAVAPLAPSAGAIAVAEAKALALAAEKAAAAATAAAGLATAAAAAASALMDSEAELAAANSAAAAAASARKPVARQRRIGESPSEPQKPAPLLLLAGRMATDGGIGKPDTPKAVAVQQQERAPSSSVPNLAANGSPGLSDAADSSPSSSPPRSVRRSSAASAAPGGHRRRRSGSSCSGRSSSHDSTVVSSFGVSTGVRQLVPQSPPPLPPSSSEDSAPQRTRAEAFFSSPWSVPSSPRQSAAAGGVAAAEAISVNAGDLGVEAAAVEAAAVEEAGVPDGYRGSPEYANCQISESLLLYFSEQVFGGPKPYLSGEFAYCHTAARERPLAVYRETAAPYLEAPQGGSSSSIGGGGSGGGGSGGGSSGVGGTSCAGCANLQRRYRYRGASGAAAGDVFGEVPVLVVVTDLAVALLEDSAELKGSATFSSSPRPRLLRRWPLAALSRAMLGFAAQSLRLCLTNDAATAAGCSSSSISSGSGSGRHSVGACCGCRCAVTIRTRDRRRTFALLRCLEPLVNEARRDAGLPELDVDNDDNSALAAVGRALQLPVPPDAADVICYHLLFQRWEGLPAAAMPRTLVVAGGFVALCDEVAGGELRMVDGESVRRLVSADFDGVRRSERLRVELRGKGTGPLKGRRRQWLLQCREPGAGAALVAALRLGIAESKGKAFWT